MLGGFLLLFAWLVPISQAQLQTLTGYTQCYPQLNNAIAAWESIGNNANSLCNSGGNFIQAYNQATNCVITAAATAVPADICTGLDTPRSICGLTAAPKIAAVQTATTTSAAPTTKTTTTVAPAPTTQAPSSIATTTSTPSSSSPKPTTTSPSATMLSSSVQSQTTTSRTSSTVAAAPVSSSVQSASSRSPSSGSPTDPSTSSLGALISGSPTNTATASSLPATISPSSELSTGAKAGIAVGVILAIIAILAMIFFVLHRRRKQAKVRETHPEISVIPEKAQLDSREYHLRRGELEGSTGFGKYRSVNGVHELEYSPTTSSLNEMSANEVAANEMGTNMSHRGF